MRPRGDFIPGVAALIAIEPLKTDPADVLELPHDNAGDTPASIANLMISRFLVSSVRKAGRSAGAMQHVSRKLVRLALLVRYRTVLSRFLQENRVSP